MSSTETDKSLTQNDNPYIVPVKVTTLNETINGATIEVAKIWTTKERDEIQGKTGKIYKRPKNNYSNDFSFMIEKVNDEMKEEEYVKKMNMNNPYVTNASSFIKETETNKKAEDQKTNVYASDSENNKETIYSKEAEVDTSTIDETVVCERSSKKRRSNNNIKNVWSVK